MIYVKKDKDPTEYINEASEDAIVFHDLDEAIIGLNQHGELVYSYTQMHEIFMQDQGMDSDEAVEWIDYNVIGTMAGKGFQILFT